MTDAQREAGWMGALRVAIERLTDAGADPSISARLQDMLTALDTGTLFFAGADRLGLAPNARGDNWVPEQEERFALALAPLMRGIAEDVRAKLPPDVHYGILVVVPPPASTPRADGRVLAVTSDPVRLAVAAAQWAMTRLPDGTRQG